ncbi:hypothetical protein BS17DRAFT_788858, partial [Gyrodon lividus]
LQNFRNHLISVLLGCDTIFASMMSPFPPPQHNHSPWTKKPPEHCLAWHMCVSQLSDILHSRNHRAVRCCHVV